MRIKHLIIPAVVAGVIGAVTFIAVDELRKKALGSLTESPAYRVTGPLVSLVIPALEEQDYLPLLLTSIENQTYQPIEVIVVDSSPPESHVLTAETCRQYGTICMYVPELGVAHARNEGARHAQGDILVFSDADNVLAPDCIERLVESLEEGSVAAHPVECILDDGLAAFGAVWTTNWLKRANATTRAVAIWRQLFDQVEYDESCDPMQGCREDLKLGQDIIERFGPGSIKLNRDALIGTSARRFKQQGLIPGRGIWEYRGVRDGVLSY